MHCGDGIEPDLMYLYRGVEQDWERWIHSPPKNQRACDLSVPEVRAEPENWEDARWQWVKYNPKAQPEEEQE